ncbi:uncharacterized protein LOC127122127 [Lathyrus oleraceus]|uniref:uncharacterized protein LOC127122127 n=1 Tax=Pisum sativum TaxID=3888 RepID=UPI0021D0C06C|nr:uncharacterized protein LOC127122127 [Pisum sativum]
MLTKIQALLTGAKQKLDKEQVNMTEKCDTTLLQTMPTKLKDPSKLTISCNIDGVEISSDLCDLGPSINLMPLNKVKELKLEEIIPSNITPTLANLSITHPHSVLQDLLVYVNGLFFTIDFYDDLETCYQIEDKGIKDDKGRNKGQLSGVRVSLAPDVLRHGPSS